MFSQLLRQGVEAAEDPTQYSDLAECYGTWQVPKTYLHLWPENPVCLDWDHPLTHFGGMTAFQVSTGLGFACHKSQTGGVTGYITAYSQAGDIPKYSPCEYGLYRSTVGPDTGERDFFENLTSYRQQRLDDTIASMREALLQKVQATCTLAEIRQQRSDLQQESRRIQDKMEVLSRRDGQVRLGICLSALSAVSAGVILVLLLLRKGRK